MAADSKATIEQMALKFFQRGQFRKAIAEYQRILAMDPKDLRIRIKLLDLYGRENMRAEATEECRKITSTYVEQGFVLRAIAVWKQALKIDPQNQEIYLAMGELYLKQELIGDAIAAFKMGVDLMRKSRDYEEAAKLLRKMEDLAPDNVAIKIHLAETYLEAGDQDAFIGQALKTLDQLRHEGRARKLLTTLEGFYEKSGGMLEIIKELVGVCLELGEEEKATEALRKGLSEDPEDLDLRVYAVRVNLITGNLTDARKVAMGIRDQYPDNIYVLEQLAAIAKTKGDEDELCNWYRETARAYGSLNQPGMEEQYYKMVLAVCPEDAEARMSLGKLTEEGFGEFREYKGEDDFFGSGSLDIDFDKISSGSPVPSEPFPTTPTIIDEGLIEADLYLKYGLDDKAFAKLEGLLVKAPENQAVRAKLRDLHWRRGDQDGWIREQIIIARQLKDQGRASDSLRAFEAVMDVDPDNMEARSAIEMLKTGKADFFGEQSEYAHLDEEMEHIDNLIKNGDTGEAVSMLLRLQETHPENSELATRLADLGWMTSTGQAAKADETFEDIKADLGDIEFDVASSIAGFEDVEVSELDDILKEFKSGVAEKLDDSDYQTHYDLGMAYKEMGLFEEALHELTKAAQYLEKAKNAYTTIAMIYRETGKMAEARSSLRVALAVPSNTPEDRAAILYELGLLAEEEGDFEGAANAYGKVEQIDPDHRELKARLARVKDYLKE